ncbi:MAG: YchJ family protein [Planctomycetota bacterium]|jgi:SEC-C motif-containing protein
MTQCPCGTGRAYDDCCGPQIAGETFAPTAEALMRSRYTAYSLGKIDHVGNTHDPETRGEFDAKEAREWSEKAEWHGLEILSTGGGGELDSEGTVEFVARYDINGQNIEHHEIAEFRRDGGRWYFRDGKEVPITVRRDQPKVGRNDPCPCGSGKKHKKCHGR